MRECVRARARLHADEYVATTLPAPHLDGVLSCLKLLRQRVALGLEAACLVPRRPELGFVAGGHGAGLLLQLCMHDT